VNPSTRKFHYDVSWSNLQRAADIPGAGHDRLQRQRELGTRPGWRRGPGFGSWGAGFEGGTAVSFYQSTPDPAEGGGFHLIQTGLGETLFKLGHDLRPEPWLATGVEQLDEKTWEITLRQGVKFHNGALMDAAAVKASLERAITKSPTPRPCWI
jgi:ABC-type transport system substrate-binding protein